ncbi:hypothetical protein PF005_g2444 [Phytophthora fragariae]|uniref:Uncharacterized protein n=2 Tax=Phytophthora fragariae TaxID=53985 RepID=A0A6A3ZA49_9STRA|nr:hypothetical protein PF011_g3177 [Phytophthora fragariae]KAE9233179.1 hypothetical protein PF005_g2444 [Phytophthora fragariae]
MVGVSAKQLRYEGLRPGDSVEYYSFAFVAGDPRDHRLTTVISGDATNLKYPIQVATEEPIPTEMMVKRITDRHGNDVNGAKWHKLRTFTFFNGIIAVLTERNKAERVVAADTMSDTGHGEDGLVQEPHARHDHAAHPGHRINGVPGGQEQDTGNDTGRGIGQGHHVTVTTLVMTVTVTPFVTAKTAPSGTTTLLLFMKTKKNLAIE